MDNVARAGTRPQDDREPPRPMAHYLLAALVMVVILVTQIVSQRGILLGNVPDVLHVADIRDPNAVARAERLMYGSYPYVIANPALRPSIEQALAGKDWRTPSPPMVGYSVREIVFLGMPFFAYREAGYVMYRKLANRRYMAGLGEEPGEILRKELGSDPTAGWFFPFWQVGWGWLAVLSVAAFGLLEWRSHLIRRKTLGLL